MKVSYTSLDRNRHSKLCLNSNTDRIKQRAAPPRDPRSAFPHLLPSLHFNSGCGPSIASYNSRLIRESLFFAPRSLKGREGIVNGLVDFCNSA